MPGSGEVMEGAMQQAAQEGRQNCELMLMMICELMHSEN
jgi:hypothetical protein